MPSVVPLYTLQSMLYVVSYNFISVLPYNDGRNIMAKFLPSISRQLLEEFPSLVGLIEQVFGRHTQHLHDFVHLVQLVGTTKQRLSRVHLHQNTAKRPHIDGEVVRNA